MQRSTSTAFLQRVRQTIRRHAMLRPGDRVLVAVSGGPDSVALLGALAALAEPLDIEVCAAHFNHHLRGAESLRDQRCAQLVADRLGVRCIAGDAAALLGQRNLEARAREQRYAFLARVAAVEGCSRIATGHTMNDQAETLLLRLLRGSGFDGLAGIQAVREGHIVRALIDCSRQQVLAFLAARRLPFCEDSSNADRRLLRNRVRHEVVPLLQSINPRVLRTLAATADIVAGEAKLLEERAGVIVAGAGSFDGALSAAAVIAAPPALRGRVVRTWLRAQRGDLRRLTAAHVRAIVDLALGVRPSARVRLPGTERVLRSYAKLQWRMDDSAPAAVRPARELVPGSCVSLDSGWCISAELDRGRRERPDDLWEVAADADTLGGPLLVRAARPGDRIQPHGMRGHRKLQDIFVDRKLPRDDRWSFPVVEAAGEILWVPGMVRGNAALITPETRAALRLFARKAGIAGA